ncbi:MAG TPA: hypothetical protein VF885_00800 [Arthrobacter sp.]
MTIPRVSDIIESLLTPYLTDGVRGQLIGVDALEGLARADEFHSLQTWPAGDARYYLVYNDVSAVLFLDEELVGVAPFERRLLSRKNPAKKFSKPYATVLAEGAL